MRGLGRAGQIRQQEGAEPALARGRSILSIRRPAARVSEGAGGFNLTSTCFNAFCYFDPENQCCQPVLLAGIGSDGGSGLGYCRNYSFNQGDLTTCGDVIFNYVEGKEAVPWADLRYLIGEVFYGTCAGVRWRLMAVSAGCGSEGCNSHGGPDGLVCGQNLM